MLKQVRELLELSDKQFHEVELSKEEFHEWSADPTTEKVMRLVFNFRELIKEQTMQGMTLGENSGEDTAQAVGITAGLDFLLTMEYDDQDERGEDDGSEDESSDPA